MKVDLKAVMEDEKQAKTTPSSHNFIAPQKARQLKELYTSLTKLSGLRRALRPSLLHPSRVFSLPPPRDDEVDVLLLHQQDPRAEGRLVGIAAGLREYSPRVGDSDVAQQLASVVARLVRSLQLHRELKGNSLLRVCCLYLAYLVDSGQRAIDLLVEPLLQHGHLVSGEPLESVHHVELQQRVEDELHAVGHAGLEHGVGVVEELKAEIVSSGVDYAYLIMDVPCLPGASARGASDCRRRRPRHRV